LFSGLGARNGAARYSDLYRARPPDGNIVTRVDPVYRLEKL
jgi:hypothetical protein